jgi:type VI secretion system secreted protein Hcp
MATDYFMKIDGIPGDTTDSKHPDEIKVTSWSWGETNPSTVVPTTSSKSDLQDFHFTAKTSKASPLLFINCAAGTRSTTAVLTGRKIGATPAEYLKITLTDVLISSYQVAGNAADDVPLDQVSLEFAKIQISYSPQNPDGSLSTPITRGWDRVGSKGF